MREDMRVCLCERSNLRPMRITLFDNHDSFTWNLAHDLGRAGCHVKVIRDGNWAQETWTETDALVLSPGPGLPHEKKQLLLVVAEAVDRGIPLFGVCLGMQALNVFFGGTLVNLDFPLHGRCTQVIWEYKWSNLFGVNTFWNDLPNPMPVGHYHSWVVNEKTLPTCLKVNAHNESGLPMAIAHESLPIAGVQFHPESVLTPNGRELLQAWVKSLE